MINSPFLNKICEDLAHLKSHHDGRNTTAYRQQARNTHQDDRT
jgi:hypothetical protein